MNANFNPDTIDSFEIVEIPLEWFIRKQILTEMIH